MTRIDIWYFISFGQGIYTSSAANKYVPSSSMRWWRWLFTRSASYSPNGIMFLNKVVLGKVHNVGQFEAVKSCPSGSNSVSSFGREAGEVCPKFVHRLFLTGWMAHWTRPSFTEMMRSDQYFLLCSAESWSSLQLMCICYTCLYTLEQGGFGMLIRHFVLFGQPSGCLEKNLRIIRPTSKNAPNVIHRW